MSDSNQILNIIKEELQRQRLSRFKILNTLSDLRLFKEGLEFDPKEEWRYLPDAEFFKIVGETFNLNREFFMKELYKPFRNKVGKSIGDEKLKEMEKYIIEKYCLYEGEQLLFECEGKIRQTIDRNSTSYQMTKGFSVSSGWILITNYRIIAQGRPKGKSAFFSDIILDSIRRRRSKKEPSIKQDIFCYGYQFPIKNFNLNKKDSPLTYISSITYNLYYILIKISLPLWSSSSITGDRAASEVIREEKLSKIFEILKKNAN